MKPNKITDEQIALIKGMLLRGDKQQWIAAWFGGEINSGRIAEINTGEKHSDIEPVLALELLPPRGPYVSGSGAHRALVALLPVKAAIDRAIEALSMLDTER